MGTPRQDYFRSEAEKSFVTILLILLPTLLVFLRLLQSPRKQTKLTILSMHYKLVNFLYGKYGK